MSSPVARRLRERLFNLPIELQFIALIRDCDSGVTTTKPYYIGVDWSSDIWLAVVYMDRRYDHVSGYPDIESLWDHYEDSAERIVIDVPIGLYQKGDRADDEELVRDCDKQARTVIGPQYRSVFNPPAREAANAAKNGEPYEDVKEYHQVITGKGLTQQAYHIGKGIAQVDQLLQNGGDPERLVEGHPEVCFWAFADTKLEHAKKYAPGVAERVAALKGVVETPAETIRQIASDVGKTDHPKVGLDDILDAMALALTARPGGAALQKLPNDQPPVDSTTLPMQMVYRADEPFDVQS